MKPAEACAIANEQIAWWHQLGWTAEMVWQALTATSERNHADWSAVRHFLVGRQFNSAGISRIAAGRANAGGHRAAVAA